MTTIFRITRNFGFLAISQGVSILVSIVIISILTKNLEIRTFGIYGIIAAVCGILVAVPFGGLTRILEREVARAKERVAQFLFNTLFIRSCLAAITFGVIILCANMIEQFQVYFQAILWAATWLAISPIVCSYNEIFVAFERMHLEAISNTIYKFFMVVFVLLAFRFDKGLSGVFLAKFLARGVQCLFNVTWAHTLICPFRPKLSLEMQKYLLKEAIPVGVSEFIQLTFYQVDELLLGRLGGAGMVGLFHGPLMIIQGILLLPTQMMRSSFPSFSRAYNTKREVFVEAYRWGFKLMFLLGLPIMATIYYFSPDIIGLVLDDKFADSVYPLKLLSFSTLLIFPEIFLRFMLISAGKQIYDTMSIGCSIVIKVLLQLILIPYYNVMGAAIGLVISQVIMVSIGYVAVSQLVGKLSAGIKGIIVTPLMATGCLVGCYYLLSDLNFLLVIPIGFALYIVLLYMFNAFSEDEIVFLKEIIKSE